MTAEQFQFERFVESSEVKDKIEAKATIHSDGLLALNEGARAEFAIHDYSHAVLFYDAAAKVIGIKCTNNAAEEGAIALRLGDKNSFLAAGEFFEKYQVEYRSGPHQFPMQCSNGEIMFFRLADLLPVEEPEEIPNEGGTEV